MKFALPAAAAALLSLWVFFIRRRLTILRENVDQAFKRFHAQQLCRINALAALFNSSVNKLNRELRRFPVSGRLLGFRKREYIEG